MSLLLTSRWFCVAVITSWSVLDGIVSLLYLHESLVLFLYLPEGFGIRWRYGDLAKLWKVLRNWFSSMSTSVQIKPIPAPFDLCVTKSCRNSTWWSQWQDYLPNICPAPSRLPSREVLEISETDIRYQYTADTVNLASFVVTHLMTYATRNNIAAGQM